MQALKILKKKIKASKRRFLQGEVKDSGDSEFDGKYTQYQSIESALMMFQEQVKHLCDHFQRSLEFESMIAVDLLYFFDSNSTHREDAKLYLKKCRGASQKFGSMVESIRDNVLEPLNTHIRLLPTIKKMVKKRNNKRIDLRAYKQRLEESRQKSGKKYLKKLMKFQRAEAIFEKINQDLMRLFDDYISYREKLLDTFIPHIIDMQKAFFSMGANKCLELADMLANLEPHAQAKPKPLNKKIQDIEKDMAQFETTFAKGAAAAQANPVAGTTADGQYPTANSPPTKTPHAPPSPPRRLLDFKFNVSNPYAAVWVNKPFDTKLPFEERHRLNAPSEEIYNKNKRRSFEIAVYGYNNSNPDELSFNPGDLIEVLEIREGGWWMGTVKDKSGLFPCNYTQPHVL
mmetsp:Transcript_25494/g.45301  ORF Transcript_25494/g.45301 Transcript_25494/m.45301 type:complete len:401 (-) Transcript_25494:334-1536(-)|eukprot:CAMPEP_0197528798 /NCGR_PEP_ID=MMETSP1318-20131121/26336_1 /TAXON_ID=552666 /ORGANISM="Partenskyella glossopodia, Strain RCC365" /LENGTH=400 /DNA_ID=CAMNT_0043084031 /DNA_START=217 /DNA_END=1419 /DNA_ORIENTATION=+